MIIIRIYFCKSEFNFIYIMPPKKSKSTGTIISTKQVVDEKPNEDIDYVNQSKTEQKS